MMYDARRMYDPLMMYDAQMMYDAKMTYDREGLDRLPCNRIIELDDSAAERMDKWDLRHCHRSLVAKSNPINADASLAGSVCLTQVVCSVRLTEVDRINRPAVVSTPSQRLLAKEKVRFMEGTLLQESGPSYNVLFRQYVTMWSYASPVTGKS
ncbi:hypothetical protein NDN08_000606 [Rhodosorus marinus]|uniref:Uncharacterized protein n=1 Tax=Rhodosorus marinus TaxID=101924 RepID=A0AAV8USI4_9RHOD|nr:hypothetical protein NDN08_000606 [Rhodosorus marinus]